MTQEVVVRQVLAEVAALADCRRMTVRQVLAEVAHVYQGTGPEVRVRQVLAEVAWTPVTGDLYAVGNDLGEYEGDERGVPLSSDRSAWDDVNYPERHASDLKDGRSLHHLPPGADDGEAPLWDAALGEWLPGDVLTPEEHTAIGDSAPHHARAHNLASADDHPDVDPSARADGRVLVWRDMAGKYVHEEQTGSGGGGATVPAGYAESVGDGVEQTFTVTHSLGTWDVLVQAYDADASPTAQVVPHVEILSADAVRVTFTEVPDEDQYRVLVVAAGVEAPDSHDPVTLSAEASDLLALTDQEIDLETQSANTILAGPTSGADAKPAFRVLVADDLPDHAHVEADITDRDHTDPDALHANGAGEIHALDAKATPADADEVVIEDSADGWTKKRVALSALGGGDMTNPMTAAEDLIVGGADGAPVRLAKGTDGQALKMVAGAVAWDTDETSAGGGADEFTDLTDAPASYVGHGGKYVAVKATEDGLEFL